MEILTLKGVALSKYGSIQNFANALGWNRNKVIRITNGVQSPTDTEIEQMAKALDISTFDSFMRIFFAELYTSCTDNSKHPLS